MIIIYPETLIVIPRPLPSAARPCPLSSDMSALCAASISFTFAPNPCMVVPFSTMLSNRSSISSVVPTTWGAGTPKRPGAPQIPTPTPRTAWRGVPITDRSRTCSRLVPLGHPIRHTSFLKNSTSCLSIAVSPGWPSTMKITPANASMATMAMAWASISVANRVSAVSKSDSMMKGFPSTSWWNSYSFPALIRLWSRRRRRP